MKTFEIDKAFEIVSGQPRRNDTSVFAVVRDEMYFLPAFLDHYRGLGYDQFVFLDDFSEDGTFEFLLDQSDCVVLRSSYRYGEPIKTDHFKKGKLNRAGIYLKYLIQTMLFEEQYITHVDADEFLIFPEQFNGISDLVYYLKTNEIKSIHASSIEFFPENISSVNIDLAPQTFAEILNHCPFFDNTKLLELRSSPNHRDVATIVGKSASSRLFERESIRDLRLPWADFPQFLLKRLPFKTAQSHVIKTPIAFRDKELQNGWLALCQCACDRQSFRGYGAFCLHVKSAGKNRKFSGLEISCPRSNQICVLFETVKSNEKRQRIVPRAAVRAVCGCSTA